MSYSVKELSDLAGVSRRTLHFYDQVGLLTPARNGENGYRLYSDQDLLRLQQILFFRELDFNLDAIRRLVDSPGFDLVAALGSHKRALLTRANRLDRLIQTVDKTVSHLKGVKEMAEKELYEGFSDEKQREYEQEARERWGADNVNASVKRWNAYTPGQREAIKWAGHAILLGIRDHMAEGPESPAVQQLVRAYHMHMGFFYECSLEIFAALGQGYSQDPRFADMYRKNYHEAMPEFLTRAIEHYVAAEQ